MRFTRAMPLPLAALVVTGAVLAVVQLDRIDALWTTNYGVVLSCKLVAVAALLALAALNRYRLAPRWRAVPTSASRALVRSIASELAIAGVIVALVAGWRFTPPPRTLAAAAPVEIHLHGERAMAQLSLTPVRGRDPDVTVLVLDGELRPLTVKEVTLVLANPAAGIEPVRRAATGAGEATWRVERLRIPVAGRWTVRVDLLIDDFEKVVLEDRVELPRLP
jgi:copper transport protein